MLMSDWSHGYNVSVGYTYGFYRELVPDWLDLCARIQGMQPPERGPNGEFRYLELGCGQGITLCILAALYPNARFLGIDFNPEHIAHARALADAGGLTNVDFIEGDFAVLAADWPEALAGCDYVALHGIYSWIPQAVREALLVCIDKASCPGALIYVSYNCMPGWLSAMPFQHLARRLQTTSAMTGPEALTKAAEWLDQFGELNSPLTRALPTLTQRSQLVRTQDPAYAVQEYLHDNWHPLWFGTVADEFARIKCTHVGSAFIPEGLMPAMMPPAMRDMVTQQSDPVLRNELMDCLMNQGFRRDIFCRGPRKMFPASPSALLQVRLAYGSPPKDNEVVISTNVGEAKLPTDILTAVSDALRKQPQTIADLLKLPAFTAGNDTANIQVVLLIVHAGVAMVDGTQGPVAAAQRMNAAIARAAAQGAPYSFLAAPALSTAFKVRDIDCLLLASWLDNPSCSAESLGTLLADGLARLGRGLLHEGQTLSGAELRDRATRLAETFLTSALPRWRDMGAIA